MDTGSCILSRPLTVGSWPGSGNNYAGVFFDSLGLVGIAVVGLNRPWDGIGKSIDLLHIHWPEQIFWGKTSRIGCVLRAAAALAALAFLRLRGVKLVWCVHNLEPHDADQYLLRLWWIYAGIISFLVNGFVTLSPSTIKVVRNSFSGLAKKPAIFVWQPKFMIQPKSLLGSAWRERHGIDSATTVLGFIGTVTYYKGVTELASAFIKTTNPRLRLVIAGQTDDIKIRRFLYGIAARDKRILLDLRWLTDDELLETTLAADAIILPFVRTLHSASIIYGLSCGKVVVTPASPFATDIQVRIGPQWIKTYEPPLSANTLSTLGRQSEEGLPNLDFLSIGESGSKLKEFYRMLKYHH